MLMLVIWFLIMNRKEVIDKNLNLEISPLEEWAAKDFEINGTDSEYFGLIDKELARVAGRMKSDNIVKSSMRPLSITIILSAFCTIFKIGRAHV